jgi:hypothetical protein
MPALAIKINPASKIVLPLMIRLTKTRSEKFFKQYCKGVRKWTSFRCARELDGVPTMEHFYI